MVLHTGTISQRAAKKIPNGAAHSSAGNFISYTWCIVFFDGSKCCYIQWYLPLFTRCTCGLP